MASQQAEPPQDNLSEQKDTLLALLQKVLNPKDYEYVVQSVERGQSLTDAEIARLIESNNHKPLPENLELLNNHNAVN